MTDKESQTADDLNEIEYPETLYHYTSGPGLMGILNEDALWATHLEYMNDSSETTYVLGLLDKMVTTALADGNTISLGKEQHEISSEASKVMRKVAQGSLSLGGYVVCFSSEDDDLAQWRGYGPVNSGYSLGFNGKKLGELNKRWIPLRCLYIEAEQNQKLFDWIVTLDKSISSIPRTAIRDDRLYRSKLADALTEFLLLSVEFKHPKFKDEEEWRLFCLDFNDLYQEPQIKIRSDGAMLRPYWPLRLALGENPDLLTSVTVGPTNHLDLGCKALKLFRPGLEVRPSNIPFRGF
tara:strand:+ start:837 stop:1718 length:882 start_codon:yes stop_codon:yes gene_type:complete